MASLLPIITKIGESLLWSFLSEKVVTRIVIALVDRLVKSTKNTLDDEIWKPAKESLEKSVT